MSNDSSTAKDAKFVVGHWMTSSVQPDMNFVEHVENVGLLNAQTCNSIIKTNSLKKTLKLTIVNELNTFINANSDNCNISVCYPVDMPDDVLSSIRIYYNTKGYKISINKCPNSHNDGKLVHIKICWSPVDEADVVFDVDVMDKELESIELSTAKQLRCDLESMIKSDVNNYFQPTGPFEYIRQIKYEQLQLFNSIGSYYCTDGLTKYKIHNQCPTNRPPMTGEVTYFFKIWRD